MGDPMNDRLPLYSAGFPGETGIIIGILVGVFLGWLAS